jgi:hypothetical protein
MTVNMELTIAELHKAFRHLNEILFEGKLVTPAIVVESKGKRQAYGWCSVHKIWKDESGEVETWEIGIASEHINRPIMEVMTTLLHEMVHLHNMQNGIKDTSRGFTYHNKRFKEQCEKHGMMFKDDKPHEKYGWYNPVLKPETEAIIRELGINEEAFKVARMDFSTVAAEKKPSTYKWVCGCGTIVRSTKPEINIICGDCGTKFEREE